MKKGAEFLFFKVSLVIIVFFFLNIVAMTSSTGITGLSVQSLKGEIIFYVKESKIPEFYFFVAQWSIFFLLLLFSATHDIILMQKKNIASPGSYQLPVNKTDLDILYEMLKKEKKIPVSKISKSFKVSVELAFAWCKILESGELAEIVYPGFGEPILKIKEEKNAEIVEGSLKEKAVEKEIKTSRISSKRSFFTRLKNLFKFKRKRKNVPTKKILLKINKKRRK